MEKIESIGELIVKKNHAKNIVELKVKISMEDFLNMGGGISEITFKHDELFRIVGEGKLYSYQRLKKEGEISYQQGYYDGYYESQKEMVIEEGKFNEILGESYDEGYSEGYENARKEFEQVKVVKAPKPIGKGGRKSALTDVEKAEVKALHELGESLRQIAERYSVSHQTIKHILNGRKA